MILYFLHIFCLFPFAAMLTHVAPVNTNSEMAWFCHSCGVVDKKLFTTSLSLNMGMC